MNRTQNRRAGRLVRACLAVVLAIPAVAVATAGPAEASVSGLSIQSPTGVNARVGVKFTFSGTIAEQVRGWNSYFTVTSGLPREWKSTVTLGPEVTSCGPSTCSLSQSFTITATPTAAGRQLFYIHGSDHAYQLDVDRLVRYTVT